MNSPEASVNFVPKDPVNIPDVRENSSNIFKCPKCSETFEDQEKLNSHECEKHSRNDKNREVEGLEEKLDTDSRSRDENEEKLKSDKIQHFKCPLCDAILRDYKGGHVFTNHLWTVHWKDELNSDLGPCPLCLRTLKGQGARYFFYLTRHILRCHADLPKTTVSVTFGFRRFVFRHYCVECEPTLQKTVVFEVYPRFTRSCSQNKRRCL